MIFLTLKELSKLTGFSTNTISRVINNPKIVKKETRLIIEEAIKKYNYQPNRMAQALVNQKTNMVYLYMPKYLESTHPFVSQLVAGMVESLGASGMGLLLKRTWYEDELCDAVILVGLNIADDKRVVELSKKKPIILFGHSEIDCSWLDVDNYQGSFMMTEEVIKRGYKNLLYIGIDETKRFVNDRKQGHLDAVNKYQEKVNENIMVFTDNKEIKGYETTLEFLKKYPNIECVICASDFLAIGALRAANSLKINVPQDLSITGFDGLGFERLTKPLITTIRQPIHEVGIQLGNIVIDLINNKKTSKVNRYIMPELIINETLGER